MTVEAVRASFLLSFCFIFSVAEFPNETVFWTSRKNNLIYSSSISSWISSSQKPVFYQLSLRGSQASNGIAFDIPRRWMITSDAKGRTLILSDLMTNSASFLLIGTSKDVGQLTVDWRARNLYWADEGFGWIAMKALPDKSNTVNSFDPNFMLVVDKYLDMPTAILVHPEKHYLFWADAGKSPKIERSDLVGQNRTLIIWQSLISPTSLCIDSPTNRLYWSDPQRGTVEYSLFDGSSRKIFMAHNDYDYYGLAVYKNALLFTSPNNNITGFLSLNKNQEGESLNIDIKLDVALYEIAAFDKTLQPRNESEGCDTEVVGCDQICVHMPVDRGGTCFCQDGYSLERDGKTCTATGKVLERYLMFTNGNQICAVPISVLGLNTATASYLAYYCDSVTSTSNITRFSLDMTHKKVFYTDGKEIFQQTAFNHTTKSLVYATNGTIIDMDYDWKTKYLYWVETNDRYVYYKNVGDDSDGTINSKETTSLDVTSTAVDPHNSKIFWIAKTDEKYTLNVWDLLKEETEIFSTSLLSTPTDLEYDRLNNRLVWNDDAGFIGMIKTDGREETKVDVSPSGKPKNALTVYKHFIISTSGDNRQFTILYDLDYDVEEHLSLSYWSGDPVQDVHVYESILQPSDLENCEVDNGGCDHICLPVGDRQCACYLGYDLDTDGRSCKAGVLDSNFYVAIDRIHKSLYQIDRTTQSTYKIQTDPSNEPVSMAFDFSRGHVIWTDAKSSTVKKKSLDTTNEQAIINTASTDEEWTPSIAVDVATGNIYVTDRDNIVVVGPQNDKFTVISGTPGTIGKLALKSENGKMAWFETGATSRIVIANMDGTDERAIPKQSNTTMKAPADIVFDSDGGSFVYWCDKDLDMIEKINTESLVSTVIYIGRDLKPVSLDIDDSYIYLAPKDRRQIVRIDKVTGGSQEIVFESPLFGTFNDFFVSRDGIKGHSVCGNCNGECSNLCLPKGPARSCACNEEDSLSSDRTICQKSAVCTVDEYLGFSALKDCCTNLPNAVCRPTCQSGFSLSVSGAVACSSGHWNVSLENICENPPKTLPMIAIAAGAGGGGAALVIIIVVVVVIRRRKSGGNKPLLDEPEDPRYAPAVGGLSPTPPPRPQVEEEEVYTYLNEDEMIDVSKLRVNMTPVPPDEKLKADGMNRRGSSASGRYSKFPARDYNDDYLTASFTHGVPKEDYPHDDYHSDTHDGYLTTSVSSSRLDQGLAVTRKDSGSGVSNPAVILDSNGGTSVRYDARADREMHDLRREQLAGYMQLTDISRSMMSQPAPSRHQKAAGGGSQSSGYTTRIQRR